MTNYSLWEKESRHNEMRSWLHYNQGRVYGYTSIMFGTCSLNMDATVEMIELGTFC